MRCIVLAATLATMAAPAAAQSSANHTVEHGAFTAGGGAASSDGFVLSFGEIGAGAAGPALVGATYALEGGFVPALAPPGIVAGLRFTDKVGFVWDADRAATSYRVYRDSLSALPTLGYGTCWRQDLPAPSATDPDVPSAGDGWFYLATSVNRLDEEGGKGADSAGDPRGGTTCP